LQAQEYRPFLTCPPQVLLRHSAKLSGIVNIWVQNSISPKIHRDVFGVVDDDDDETQWEKSEKLAEIYMN
jgi:glycogen synthase